LDPFYSGNALGRIFKALPVLLIVDDASNMHYALITIRIGVAAIKIVLRKMIISSAVYPRLLWVSMG
jgi:hypothetical protein